MRASVSPHRTTRLIALLAVAATLVLPAEAPAMLATGAKQRTSTPSHGSCHAAKPGARHSCKRHVSKRHVRKHAARKHTATNPKIGGGAKAELVAATCEDGTIPSHAGGGAFSCGDGSAPNCELGALVGAAATTRPMCAVKPGEKEAPTVEYVCEAASEASGEQGCETGTEQEALEAEEEE